MRKFDNYCHALDRLATIQSLRQPYTLVEKAGIANLFNICFEQSWKLIREVLDNQGLIADGISSPRTTLKIAYQAHLINDETLWLQMLDTRNILTHTYGDEFSSSAITAIQHDYLPVFQQLRQTLTEQWF